MRQSEATVPIERDFWGKRQVLSRRPIDAPGSGVVCATASRDRRSGLREHVGADRRDACLCRSSIG